MNYRFSKFLAEIEFNGVCDNPICRLLREGRKILSL
jgi:hypothetical protein